MDHPFEQGQTRKTDDLVTANHILIHAAVIDAFGHVSVRDVEDAPRYI